MFNMKMIAYLINIGFLNTYIAKKIFGITTKKLNEYVENRILNIENVMLFGKTANIYTLSKGYMNELRRRGYYLYKHDNSQLEHDYILGKIYLACSEEERASWKNETYLKMKFGKNSNTCDAMYISSNKLIGVEVFTPDYKKNVKEDKIKFMNHYCDKAVVMNTKDFERR